MGRGIPSGPQRFNYYLATSFCTPMDVEVFNSVDDMPSITVLENFIFQSATLPLADMQKQSSTA